MNFGKLVSGMAALAIYLSLIFLVLYFYNIHQTKAKNYVEKNSDRVTVTLVNSDKTVFNKSAKVSTPKKPVPVVMPPIVKKSQPKKLPPKKIVPKKIVPKKVIPKKITRPKKVVPKKVIPKKVIPKKIAPKKKIPKKVVPKKKVPKKVVPKKVVPKKVVPKKKVPKKTAKDLFASVKTKDIKKIPVKKTPKRPAKQPSTIKHNSSMTDRIKATHQSGRTSNATHDKGTENRYKARVQQHMNNWLGEGHKGQRVTIKLTVYQSGKFKYRVVSGMSGSMQSSLKRHLDFLNSRGLGRHKNSSPHTFTVNFKIRN